MGRASASRCTRSSAGPRSSRGSLRRFHPRCRAAQQGRRCRRRRAATVTPSRWQGQMAVHRLPGSRHRPPLSLAGIDGLCIGALCAAETVAACRPYACIWLHHGRALPCHCTAALSRDGGRVLDSALLPHTRVRKNLWAASGGRAPKKPDGRSRAERRFGNSEFTVSALSPL